MIIYRTINLINNKIYIGQTKKNKEEFIESDYYGSNRHLRSSLSKYGRNNFQREIIEECRTQEYMNAREKFWIKEFNSTDSNIGYNISQGGENWDTVNKHPRIKEIRKKRVQSFKKYTELHDHPFKGCVFTQTHKEKLSLAHKGKKLSEETKQKIREANTGENHYMYGKHHSEETKQKMSIKKMGKTLSEEHKRKISEGNIGKKHKLFSQETRQKMSKAKKGTHLSKECKRRISEKTKEQWRKRKSQEFTTL